MECGADLAQPKSTAKKTAKTLFQKIALTALDLMSAQDDTWRKNTELMPDDCWMLFMNVSKGQAATYLDNNNLPPEPSLVDMLEKSFFNAHSYGLWIWVAEKKNTDPTIFNGRIRFDYGKATKDAVGFMTEWDGLLDHLDKLIAKDIEPSFAVAEAKAFDAIDNIPVLHQNLTPAQFHGLKSDLKGAIYRGYLLHRFFKA